MAGEAAANAAYVPSWEASGKLIVGFSRNPAKFKMNQYVKMIPVKKQLGYYLVITAEEAARVINSNLSDLVWADGAEAPMGDNNRESFVYNPFRCVRYAAPFTLGYLSEQQADWPIMSIYAAVQAQKMMTARTIKTLAVLTTTANWGSSTATATSLGGGQWDSSTSTLLYIKKTLGAASEAILQATLGVIQYKDLLLVVNPHVARRMAESQEIIDLIKQSPFALAQIRGDAPSQNGQWGMPDTIYGMKFVVEDAVRVTSKKGATKATTYCLGNDSAFIMARPGEIEGMEGIPDFSTLQQFMMEEFTVESMDDPNNRRTVGRVVENYDVQLVAPASGYLIQSPVAA